MRSRNTSLLVLVTFSVLASGAPASAETLLCQNKKSPKAQFKVVEGVACPKGFSLVTGLVSKGDVASLALAASQQAVAERISGLPAGPKGERGDTGAQGMQGLPGQVGPAGAAGPTGARGATGERGPAGERGAVGERGIPGESGPVGPQGPRGEVGPQGAVGPQGPVGPVGAQGPAGRVDAVAVAAGVNQCVTVDLREMCAGDFGCTLKTTLIEPALGRVLGVSAEMRFRESASAANTAQAAVYAQYDGIERTIGQAGFDNITLWAPWGIFALQNNRSGCQAGYVAPAQINSAVATSRYIDPFTLTLRAATGFSAKLRVERN